MRTALAGLRAASYCRFRSAAMTETPGYVYVIATLTPRGARTYVGWALDPDRRLSQHNSGRGAKSTRGGQWFLLYVERHESRMAAMSREWHLKRDRRFRAELARGVDRSPAAAGQIFGGDDPQL